MDFIDQITNIFAKEYEATRGLKYEIMEKDRKAVGLMLKRAKETHPNDKSEDMLKKFENLFKKALAINSDKFLSGSMTLPFLNSQINKIKLVIQKEDLERSRIKPMITANDIKKIFPDAEEIFKGFSKEDKEFMKREEEKPLTRSEYVRKFGGKAYSDKEYRQYLSKFA